MSNLQIKDLSNVITEMCPIQIWINNQLEWDDETGTLDEYYMTLQRTDIVDILNFKIVAFHHSIVFISTLCKF